MRLVFKSALCVLHPFGFLNSKTFSLSDESVELIGAKRSECVLISLKNVIYFDKNTITSMIALLQEISSKLGVAIGFCDYQAYKHKLILKYCGIMVQFSLFETQETALLFFGRIKQEQLENRILLFNSNVQKRDFIKKHLVGRGYECDIAQDFKEFLSKKPDYKYHIGSWTTLYASKGRMEVFYRDDVVVYRIYGLIDSDFEQSFDMALHKALVMCGFKFFALVVEAISITNIRGANFLSDLAKDGLSSGVNIGVCGINKSSVPDGILGLLQKNGIYTFASIDDFVSHNKMLCAIGKYQEAKLGSINKQLVQQLPRLIQLSIDTIQITTNSQIERSELSLANYYINEDCLCGAVAFYGDMEFKIIINLPKDILSIAQEYTKANSQSDAFVEIIDLISTKVLNLFLYQKVRIYCTYAKIFSEENHSSYAGQGACVQIKLAQKDGLIFLSR